MNKFSNAEPGGTQEGDPAHFYYLLMPGREILPRGARCSILESRLSLFFFSVALWHLSWERASWPVWLCVAVLTCIRGLFH